MFPPMRISTLLGVVLVAVGGFVLARGLSYTSERSVIRVGEFEASVEEKRTVPAWAGGLALVAGIGLIVLGSRRR